MALISGVSAEIEEAELKELIERENEGLKASDMTVIKRYKCNNPWKTNWVIRMPGAHFKQIIKKGKINLRCESLFVEEYVGVLMCYRCCRYGHLAKVCSEKEICYDCGEERGEGHGRGKCVGKERKCVNCWRAYGKVEGHWMRSQECPVYRSNVEKARRMTKYNG